jgi:putative hydrolase of the HAD superfamily
MRTVDPRPRRELEHELGLETFGSDRLVFGHPMWDQVQLGHRSSAEFWEAIADQLGIDADGLASFRRRFWSGDRLDIDLVELVRELGRRGYLIGLLSNNPSSLRQRVDELMPDLFDATVISGADGVMKPDAAIYELATRRLGVAGSEAVFVDDYERNVIGARRAGLQAVHFRGLAPLREDLRALGVDVPDPVISAARDIRAVIFDWGGVIEMAPSVEHHARWAKELGVTPEELHDALWGRDHRQLEVGLIDSATFASRLAPRLRLADADAAEQFLRDYFADNRILWPVIAAIRGLRARYKVGLLTNSAPDFDERARALHDIDVDLEFDARAASTETGLRKPDPAIYELLLDQLGCRPEQAVLVDDSLRSVDAARALGMHTVQFVWPDTSLRELESLLGHSIADSSSGSKGSAAH